MAAASPGLRPGVEVAADLGLSASEVVPYGPSVVKVPVACVRARAAGARRGKLVLVTAMTPTRFGEGKTVTSIGVGMGLRRLGQRAVVCLRQPSLGPVFGVKGGAAGGGRATVEPQETVNLGLTGDLDAVAAAHNLIAAMLDNHVFHGNALGVDPASIVWPRTLDVEDRLLRRVQLGAAGDPRAPARTDRFVIAAASEVMAVLGLARDYADLKERLGRMLLALRTDGRPVRVNDVGASGAAAALLRNALSPNLAQTSDGTPVLVHGGPFANIAHGTCSRLAIELALATGDYAVVEAGFATDLGAEKFVDLLGPITGLEANAAVLVATIRGLRYHGGVADADIGRPDRGAVERGLENLAQHLENLRTLGLPTVVAANRFPGDSAEEREALERFCAAAGVPLATSTVFDDGAAGAEALAQRTMELCARGQRARPLYAPGTPLERAMEAIVTRLYGGNGVALAPEAAAQLARLRALGEADGPVCMAKTPNSLSDDPKARGRPRGFVPTVRRFSRSAGAGFTVAFLGEVETMPGLPTHPLAEQVDLTADGRVTGLR